MNLKAASKFFLFDSKTDCDADYSSKLSISSTVIGDGLEMFVTQVMKLKLKARREEVRCLSTLNWS